MHPATPAADRAIVTAVDTLNRHSATLKVLRDDLGKIRLPIAAAEDRLDHIDDLLATVNRMLANAYSAMEPDFTRILKADDARYDAAHLAEMEEAAAADDAYYAALRPANDDTTTVEAA